MSETIPVDGEKIEKVFAEIAKLLIYLSTVTKVAILNFKFY